MLVELPLPDRAYWPAPPGDAGQAAGAQGLPHRRNRPPRRPLQYGYLPAQFDHLGTAPAVYRPRLPYPASGLANAD